MTLSKWQERDSATNATVTLTKPAEFGRTHKLQVIQASFNLGATTQEVVVTINAVEFFRAPVEPDAVNSTWTASFFGSPNEALIVTLDAGGLFNVGTLFISGITE